jgi:hypothetical protein
MEKYGIFTRIFLIAPALVFASVLWVIIGVISTNSLGEVLKKTGENLLRK